MIQLTRPLPQVIIILHASRSFTLTNAGFGFECDASGEGVWSSLHPLLCKAILHIIITGVIDCARYISKKWKCGSESAPATMHGRVAGSKATTSPWTRWQACGQRLGLSQQLRRLVKETQMSFCGNWFSGTRFAKDVCRLHQAQAAGCAVQILKLSSSLCSAATWVKCSKLWMTSTVT